jgi:hypothetical protein
MLSRGYGRVQRQVRHMVRRFDDGCCAVYAQLEFGVYNRRRMVIAYVTRRSGNNSQWFVLDWAGV